MGLPIHDLRVLFDKYLPTGWEFRIHYRRSFGSSGGATDRGPGAGLLNGKCIQHRVISLLLAGDNRQAFPVLR
jgi:hypothetical protein